MRYTCWVDATFSQQLVREALRSVDPQVKEWQQKGHVRTYLQEVENRKHKEASACVDKLKKVCDAHYTNPNMRLQL